MMRKATGGIVGLLLALAPCAADAMDGVIEINQASAAAGGVTPGDTPGFPVTISRSGSYRLTSSLTTNVRSLSLVSITADFVTLDLGGFTVSHCPSGGLCSVGTANAIDAPSDVDDVTVRNGNLQNGAGHCINLQGDRARVEDVRVRDCVEIGVVLGSEASIDGVTASGNGDLGLAIGGFGHIRNSTSHGNGDFGIGVSTGSLVESSVISRNLGGGLRPWSGGAETEPIGYRGCVIESNGETEAQIRASDQLYFRSLGSNLCGSDAICP